ncbi:MAG: glycosyl hydrolase family 8 [Chloroflexota bacterium]
MYRIYLVVVALLLLTAMTVTAQSDQSKIVNYNPNDIADAWQRYQSDHMQYVTINGGEAFRITTDSNSTVSEGQAYGMLFSVLMNDQRLFDGMWRYAQNYFNQNGLMHWQINSGGQITGTNAATDADVDMAMALIYACRRVQIGDWQANSDYCASASTMINAIWTHEVDNPGPGPFAGLTNNQGYELIPGDRWYLRNDYPDGIVNLSYFSPAYFTAFASFTGNSGWESVNTRNFQIMQQSQALGCSRLVPNWSTYQGQVQTVPWHGQTSAYWGWDAARVSWRVALSSYWYQDNRAINVLNDIGGFFDSVGLNNIRSEYRLNGSPVNSYTDTFFVAHAANAIWGMSSPDRSSCNNVGAPRNTSRQQAYNAVRNRAPYNYYNDSWRLLSMMLMTGYFNHPDESFVLTQNGGNNNPTPVPTDQPTQAPPTTVPPTQVPPTTVPTQQPTDAPTTVPPTQVPPTTVPPTQVPPTQVPPTQVPPTQIPTRIPPTAVPPTAVPPTTGGTVRTEALRTTMNNQQVQFQVRLTNTSQQAINGVSWRFYFQVDAGKSASDYVFEKYWDSTNTAQVSAPIQHSGNIYYFEIRYTGSMAPNSTWQYHGAMHFRDWTFGFDGNNDWSLNGNLANQFRETSYIPVYSNGQLIHGSTP